MTETDQFIRRPMFAAANVPCVRCGAPDAYTATPCPETAGGHVSRFDELAGC